MHITPDVVNGFFEAAGSILLWLNVRQLIRDKGEVKGVHFGPIVFFALWGVWNLYYYPAIHQSLSFIGGVSVMLANTVWLTLYGWYHGGREWVRNYGQVQRTDSENCLCESGEEIPPTEV